MSAVDNNVLSTLVCAFRQENSMHVLVGLLSGSNAQCRLEAVRCLHELSHSPHPSVGPACLPATPYLLTYLSGQSAKFTEGTKIRTASHVNKQSDMVLIFISLRCVYLCVGLCVCLHSPPQELCLYTLGNLCPDSDAIVEKLLAQGLIPALANCIQVGTTHILMQNFLLCAAVNRLPYFLIGCLLYLYTMCTLCVCVQIQRSSLAVVEAVGFTLSQLLQAKHAAEKISP